MARIVSSEVGTRVRGATVVWFALLVPPAMLVAMVVLHAVEAWLDSGA